MEQFETEVKFYLTDIADVRSSILKRGAVCIEIDLSQYLHILEAG